VGGGLCATYGIDIFVGEQPPYPEIPINKFRDSVVNPICNIDFASVEYRTFR
jgi:hypothetical protein